MLSEFFMSFALIIKADRDWLIFYSFSIISSFLHCFYFRCDFYEIVRQKHSKSFIKKHEKAIKEKVTLFEYLWGKYCFVWWREYIPKGKQRLFHISLMLLFVKTISALPLWAFNINKILILPTRIWVAGINSCTILFDVWFFINHIIHWVEYGKDGNKKQGYRKK